MSVTLGNSSKPQKTFVSNTKKEEKKNSRKNADKKDSFFKANYDNLEDGED